jgi:hypothetical protein
MGAACRPGGKSPRPSGLALINLVAGASILGGRTPYRTGNCYPFQHDLRRNVPIGIGPEGGNARR